MGFAQGITSPVGLATVCGVPGFGEPPTLFQSEGGTMRLVPLATPVVNVLFRPEKQHGLNTISKLHVPFSATLPLPLALSTRQASSQRELATVGSV